MANDQGDEGGTRSMEPKDSGRGGHDVEAGAAQAAAHVARRAPGSDDSAHGTDAGETGSERARRKEAELIGE